MNIAKSIATVAAIGVSLVSTAALAQDPNGTASWAGGTTTTTPVASAPSSATAASTEPKDDGTSDHDRFVGRFAIGYLGASDIPLAESAPVTAPTVGVRYWLNKRFGIDAGLGFGLSNSSNDTVRGATTTNVTEPSKFGFLLHGGVPIALTRGKHYTFQIVPEFNVGFSSSTKKNTGVNAPDTSLSGYRVEVGARAGAEVHFGFIGVPELSLQASVGLNIGFQGTKSTTGNDSVSTSSSGIGTTVQADPWALFTKNISALYYF
jgi:hypothetical protein